jgi:hypothetical protein
MFGDRRCRVKLKNMAKEAVPVNRDKMKQFIKRCADKASDAQLRVIALVAYHVTK